MSLVWRAQLSVGNNAIDADHKNLIELLNRIEQSLEKKDKAGFQTALDDLFRYSREHFAREERIAHAAGYPDADRLSLSHEKLFKGLDQARRDAAEITQTWPSAKIELFNNFLRDWLIGHVINEDLLMKTVLQKCPPEFMADTA